PFGTGPTDAIMYRILYAQPNIAPVPESLRPLLEAALAKEPQGRPAAHEILDQLTHSPAASAPTYADDDTPTQRMPSLTWQPTELTPSQPRRNENESPL